MEPGNVAEDAEDGISAVAAVYCLTWTVTSGSAEWS